MGRAQALESGFPGWNPSSASGWASLASTLIAVFSSSYKVKKSLRAGRGGLLRGSRVWEAKPPGSVAERAVRVPEYGAEPAIGQAGAAWRTGDKAEST